MTASGSKTVLWWPGQVLAEEDLRRHWTSQVEVVLSPKTIVTPLALDFLRGKRVPIRRDNPPIDGQVSAKCVWGLAEEALSPMVAAIVATMKREGRSLAPLATGRGDAVAWIRSIAAQVACGNPLGAVLVGEQIGLTVCIANKIRGVRAAAIERIRDVRALQETLSPNLFAIGLHGKTYFELRQLLTLTTAAPPACPDGTAKTLQELDGHAHR